MCKCLLCDLLCRVNLFTINQTKAIRMLFTLSSFIKKHSCNHSRSHLNLISSRVYFSSQVWEMLSFFPPSFSFSVSCHATQKRERLWWCHVSTLHVGCNLHLLSVGVAIDRWAGERSHSITPPAVLISHLCL